MDYRSKDIEFMNNLKQAVYKLEDNDGSSKSESFEYLRRFIVLQDLRKFANANNDLGYMPNYQHNDYLTDVDYMFVTASDHQDELALFDNFIKASGITNYYRTSYNKFIGGNVKEVASLTKALASEISVVKPKAVVIFGQGVGKYLYSDSAPLHQLIKVGDVPTITTSSLLQAVVSDEVTGKRIKNAIWKDVQLLKAYVEKNGLTG